MHGTEKARHHIPANKRALVLWTSVMLVTLLVHNTSNSSLNSRKYMTRSSSCLMFALYIHSICTHILLHLCNRLPYFCRLVFSRLYQLCGLCPDIDHIPELIADDLAVWHNCGRSAWRQVISRHPTGTMWYSGHRPSNPSLMFPSFFPKAEILGVL